MWDLYIELNVSSESSNGGNFETLHIQFDDFREAVSVSDKIRDYVRKIQEEPEEIVPIKRSDIINFYDKYLGSDIREISRLKLRKDIIATFGDKCLPDKELKS